MLNHLMKPFGWAAGLGLSALALATDPARASLTTPLLYEVTADSDWTVLAGEQVVRIGALGEKITITATAMAVRPSDNQVFIWVDRWVDDMGAAYEENRLATVFQVTGAAVLRPDFYPDDIDALAFSPSGVLYGLSDGLWQFDTVSGKAEQVGDFQGEFHILAADFHMASGTLYGVSDRNELVTVDPASGRIKVVANLGGNLGRVGAIAFVPKQDIMVATSDRAGTPTRFVIDRANGKVSEVEALSQGAVPQGLGYAIDMGACEPIGDPEHRDLVWTSNCGGQTTEGVVSVDWGFGLGRSDELKFDSGEALKLECFQGRFFRLSYLPGHDKAPVTVGECPFERGCNSASYIYAGDGNGNGKPDCLLGTQYISRDFGENDVPNPWTNESTEDPAALDWAEWVFTREFPGIGRGTVKRISHKYAYKSPPPLDCAPINVHEGDPVRAALELGGRGNADPDYGRGAESPAQAEASAEAPMIPDESMRCDADGDGRCGAEDQAALQAALGSCRVHPGYRVALDLDGDGCVTLADRALLFPPR